MVASAREQGDEFILDYLRDPCASRHHRFRPGGQSNMPTLLSIDEEIRQPDNSQIVPAVFSACPVTPSATRKAGRSIVKGSRNIRAIPFLRKMKKGE